jgi:hypothetical protein
MHGHTQIKFISILSIFFLSELGEIRCKRFARTAASICEFLDYWCLEDRAFLWVGVNEIIFTPVP